MAQQLKLMNCWVFKSKTEGPICSTFGYCAVEAGGFFCTFCTLHEHLFALGSSPYGSSFSKTLNFSDRTIIERATAIY